MLLATPEDVLERMQLQNMVGTADTKSIESALQSASQMVESILRTPLEYTTRTDYFDNSVGHYDSVGTPKLFLTQRFLTGDTLEVYNTEANGTSLRAADLSGLTPLTAEYYYENLKNGTIQMLAPVNTAYGGIAVRYTAGFQEGSTSVPEWLKEAAISAAVYIQHSQAVTHSKKDMPDMSKPLSGIIYTHVNEHIYTPYGGLYPVNSEEG